MSASTCWSGWSSLVVLVVLLAVVVHAIGSALALDLGPVPLLHPRRVGRRLPACMLWLFVLDPTVSPVSFVLRGLGFKTFVEVVQVDQLPVVLAIIAFWTGAGGWIVVMYGALNNISHDLIEAARVDGAGPIRTAWSIQIPLLRKWIAYMVILSFAGGTQLFVEPRVLSQASRGVVHAGLFAEPARLPLCLQAERLQRLGGDLAGPPGRRAGAQRLLRLPGRSV